MNLSALLRKNLDRAATEEKITSIVTLKVADNRSLPDQWWIDEAARLKCRPERIRAVKAVESVSGFDTSGRLTVAYETHVFSRNTKPKNRFNGTHPRVASRRWINVRKLARGEFHPYRLNNEERWQLAAEAMELDFDAALKAMSYGSFQILGENHSDLGFAVVEDMVRYLYEGEEAHWDVALRFMKRRGILDDMREGRWERFAKRYNGPGQVEHYSRKLREAEARYRPQFARVGV